MEPVAKERIRREATGQDGAADLDAILDAGLVGTFSTVVDGRPLSVPMLYGRVDDRLYLHGSTAGERAAFAEPQEPGEFGRDYPAKFTKLESGTAAQRWHRPKSPLVSALRQGQNT